MMYRRLLKSSVLFSVTVLGLAQLSSAQNTSSDQSWTASSRQEDPNGGMNPTRTSKTHTVVDGRVVDKTLVETLGPDGQYVLYSETEKESVQVNDTTVRNVERSFARGSDGERTLIQEKQEESRNLPGGEEKVVRSISNPDANGALQVVQRELEDSKQLSRGTRETTTTVLTLDVNGGLTPAAQIVERETQSGDGTIDFKKTTQLSDGTGRWQLSEVREGTSKQENGQTSKDERVLRPDSNGNLAVVERTVSKQTDTGPAEKRDTIDKYSTNVPGQAGDDSLQLVRREITVQQNTAAGGHSTTRQIEQANPGDPNNGLRVTEETINIVKPGGSGTADEKRTILTTDSDGRLGEVWVDIGKTSNPSVVQVDTRSAKPQ